MGGSRKMGIRELQNPGMGGHEKVGRNGRLHFSIRNRGFLNSTLRSYIIAIMYFVKAYFDPMSGRRAPWAARSRLDSEAVGLYPYCIHDCIKARDPKKETHDSR
jgi:hypothetical protein